MEAIMIAGLAVVIIGGYYSVLDMLTDLRLSERKEQAESNRSIITRKCDLTLQGSIKKMSRLHV